MPASRARHATPESPPKRSATRRARSIGSAWKSCRPAERLLWFRLWRWRISSAAMAKRFDRHAPVISGASSDVVDSEPEAIATFVRSKAPGAVRIGLETGPTATWLWTELKQLGLPVICIDARHAKAVLKMQINKSDRNDAAGIARIMQTGWFKEVRVKDLDSHSVRALLASRALLVKIKRDLENQVRGLLKNVGLVIGRAKFNVFAVRAEELIED